MRASERERWCKLKKNQTKNKQEEGKPPNYRRSTHVDGSGGGVEKKEKRSDPVGVAESCDIHVPKIIYDSRNEQPHARCETQLVRLTRTLHTG